MKKYLVILESDPYKNTFTLEGLEFALAVSAFEQEVDLLMLGAAIKQLLPQTDEQFTLKDFTKVYQGLELFGIRSVFAENIHAEYAAKLQISMPVTFLTSDEIQNIHEHYDVVVRI